MLPCYFILPLLTASTRAQPEHDSISKQHRKYFLQLSPGKCSGTDQHRQWNYLVAGLESPREGGSQVAEGRLSLSNEPSPKSQPGQCWKLGISLVSALEISDPLGTGSCSCGSPEGVPVMKPEGGS